MKLVGNKIKNSELQSYVDKYDLDKSGLIDFNEFLVLVDGLIKNRVEP